LKSERVKELIDFLDQTQVLPDAINSYLESQNAAPILQKTRISYLLLRPQLSLSGLASAIPELKNVIDYSTSFEKQCAEQAEILIKYDSYIQKEKEVADKLSRLESVKLRPDMDYNSIESLSIEARQKLTKYRPETLGQASRISGVSPSDISVIAILLGR
jgi:tRNA uridine 5-carboxymethylaminomethyl modification enzyme